MPRRQLTASLTLVLALSGLLIPAAEVSAAPTAGLYLSADMSMTPSVVHYRDKTSYDTSAVGELAVDAASPCAGTCRLTIGIYAPGREQPWSAEESAPVPGTTYPALDLPFTITEAMDPVEGVNRVVAELRDSSDVLIDTLEVTSLTIYKKLSLAPKIVALRHTALYGRRIPFRISVSLRYADGFSVPYFGNGGRAYIQRSRSGSQWGTLDISRLTERSPSKRRWVRVWDSGLYRLRAMHFDGYHWAESKPVRVKVWAQTKQARITRDRVSTNEVFQGRSVTVRGSVMAKYKDGKWHAPVPGTRYQVQYRNEGSSRWYTQHLAELRDKSFAYTFKPRATGFVRFKVLGKSSDVHRIHVLLGK